jgi:hypothetical protein
VNGLERRLSALEEIAEDMRLRPVRLLAAERGLDAEKVITLYRERQAESAALRARGWSQAQITAATAKRLGLTPAELRAQCDQLRERYEQFA